MTIAKDKEKRDKIVAQALTEIQFCRTYKQGKIANWQLNENMYYGKKTAVIESRANVDLARMQEFVHTLLSKIRKPKVFKFTKRKDSQLKRVQRLNALSEVDKQSDSWDIKILVAKKQLAIYGRMIFSYYSDSINGYKPHLDPLDVYDFLVDPSGGGIDLEKAMFLGDYGVVLSRKELEDGIKGKNKVYLSIETQELLDGDGNNTEATQEETNKRNRTYDQNTVGQKELQNTDKFKFWRWFTTFEGERYYLLLQSQAGRAIRVEKLTDIFNPTKQYPLSPWPYWSAAAFPDLTEFWTPSYCDYVREMFMVQNVNVNQMLDNAEEINKPREIIDISAIENLSELKYRRGGQIKTKGGYDPSRVFFQLRPPSIDTPIKVFELIEAIQEKASGVTAGAKGVSDEDGKVGIYEGNQQEAASRFDLLDDSITFGMNRFARLWENGVRDNLTKKIAVDMIGPDGIETEEVSKRDIFRRGDDYGVMIEDVDSKEFISQKMNGPKVEFLTNTLNNPATASLVNPKKAFETMAKMQGFDPEDIKELMDVSEYGDAELLSEASRDIELILDGESIQPNLAANNAYKQKFVDYMIDHKEDMSDKQFEQLAIYVSSLDGIIAANEARALNAFSINKLNQQDPNAIPQDVAQPAPVGANNGQVQGY